MKRASYRSLWFSYLLSKYLFKTSDSLRNYTFVLGLKPSLQLNRETQVRGKGKISNLGELKIDLGPGGLICNVKGRVHMGVLYRTCIHVFPCVVYVDVPCFRNFPSSNRMCVTLRLTSSRSWFVLFCEVGSLSCLLGPRLDGGVRGWLI